MNLHAIASKLINVVNPNVLISLIRSTGYTTADDGSRVPTTATLSGMAQIQPVNDDDLRHVEGLNVSGEMRSVYLYGTWAGIIRKGQQGGDMLVFNGSVWLVIATPENWPDWTRVICLMQLDPVPT